MHKKTITILGVLVASLVVPVIIHAATLRIAVDKSTVSIGEPIRVDITLDTQGESVNTIQSTILIPENIFRVVAINNGESIMSFWITPPVESPPGEINFAGVIPGGYTGTSGPLISLSLLPIASGNVTIGVATATVLANDGMGSALPVTLADEVISVNSSTHTGSSTEVNYAPAIPEIFTPIVMSDPNLFNGKYSLVFSTVDKGSGIDHYEVLEVATNPFLHVAPSWQVATSPYLLEDQSLSSNIYVRAVNRTGGFLVVELPAQHPFTVLAKSEVLPWTIPFACAGFVVLLAWLLWMAGVLRSKNRDPR